MWIKLILAVGFSVVSVSSSFAEGGHVGGGDPCKNTINQYRQEILGWVTRDEARELNFKIAKSPNWTYNDPAPAKNYKASMTKALQEGNVVVSCYLDPSKINDPAAQALAVKEAISYKAITIGNPAQPTACINYEDKNGISHIDCNYDLIMNTNSLGDADFVVVHHEFASIAGVEERTGTYTSDFSVSNQLSQFEHWKNVLVLGPKAQPSAQPYCSEIIDDFVNAITTQCLVPGRRILQMPEQGAESSIRELSSQLDDCLQLQKNGWKAGFAKTCSGPEVQVACLNRCKDMGLLPHCISQCGSL